MAIYQSPIIRRLRGSNAGPGGTDSYHSSKSDNDIWQQTQGLRGARDSAPAGRGQSVHSDGSPAL